MRFQVFLLLILHSARVAVAAWGSASSYRPDSSLGQIFNAVESGDDRFRLMIEAENFSLTTTTGGGQSLAHIAAKYSNFEALKYVLEREPDLIEKPDRHHCTILHLATISGHLEAVRYLVEQHNADICHMSGRFRDRTAVHAAVEFNRLEILKYFVEERKIDFNKPHPDQRIPPLFLAVRNRNWEVIQYLVEEKYANVKMLKHNEENIIFIIVREDFLGLLKYLIDERKVDFNMNWKNHHGETPVHVAAYLQRMSILEYLVEEKFANVNAQKKTDRRTPLHYAAGRDNFRACKFLVEHGADPRLEDYYGDTPADKARDRALIEYLDNAARKMPPRSAPSHDFRRGQLDRDRDRHRDRSYDP